jgi:hypothetical protein
MSSISERFMEETEQAEPTWEERAQAVLAQLTITTPEGVINDQPLPEWIVLPWAATIVDPHDPQFESSIIKAEAWLASR